MAHRKSDKKFHQAAVTYFVYGLIYFSGALYLQQHQMISGESARGGITWFIIGAIFILALPPLIWFGAKWLTRFLAVLLLVRLWGVGKIAFTSDDRIVPVPWGGEISISHGALVFLFIAAFTFFMLIRAGWDL